MTTSMIPQVMRIEHEVEADILNMYFGTMAVNAYVHYIDDHFATLHDPDTDEVVGFHVEGWTALNERAVKEAKERRAYIAKLSEQDGES